MKRKDIFFIIVGALAFAFILNRLFPENQINQSLISPLAEKINSGNSRGEPTQSEALGKIVEQSLENVNGTYGIIIKNLRTGEIYAQNADREFQTASLYKLWVAAATFKQIEDGRLTRQQTLSREIAELNRIFDIDEETAEQTEGGIIRTVEQALNEMITISANYPALLLSAEIGNSNIASYIKELGLTNSNLGQPPITTARDIAKFYELLYDGEIVNQVYSSEFMDVLRRQELNDRIPKYLPTEIRVAHKTGELGAFKHDAGIIFGKDAVLFVVLSETNSQTTAAENIAKLARDVYSYFENN